MSFKFSEFLKHELGKKVLKANELAKKLDKVPSYISKLQNEDIIPNYKDLKIIADSFEVNYEFLLFQIGIIDANTLLHINMFGSLKSYLAEVMNLTDLNEEKLLIFNNFIKNNMDKLDSELDGDLLSYTIETLGNDFVFPNYKNPYNQDAYPEYKKIPKINFRSVKSKQLDSVQVKMLPVYNGFNKTEKNIPFSEFPTTMDVLNNKSSFIGNDFFWYSPTKTISDGLYLIEKVELNNGDNVLYTDKDRIYTGIYYFNEDSIIITEAFDTQKNTSIDGPPLIVPINNSKTDIYIVGKILSVLEAR